MKAIIPNTSGDKPDVIYNVRNYTETSICGDQEVEGLSKPFILVSDDTDETKPETWTDLKSQEDAKKVNQAKINELQDKLTSMDYIITQRRREQDLGMTLSKTDEEYQTKLNEMQAIVEEIRKLEKLLPELQ